MRKIALWGCVLFLFALTLCGCSFIRIEEEQRVPVEYTIAEPEEIPKEAAGMIEGKKAHRFQMTYQSGEDYYLIKGFGQQMTGGYSIQVEEVSASSNAVFLRRNS